MGKTPHKWHFIIYEGWLLLHSSWRKMLLQRKWSFVRVIESTITLHKLFLQNQSGFPAESQSSCLQGNWNRKSRLFWFCLMSSFSSQQYLQYLHSYHKSQQPYINVFLQKEEIIAIVGKIFMNHIHNNITRTININHRRKYTRQAEKLCLGKRDNDLQCLSYSSSCNCPF